MSEQKGPITEEYQKKHQKELQQSGEDRALAQYVGEQHSMAERAKLGVVEDAWLGAAFYTGNQWVRFNRVLNRLTSEDRPMWRVRMVLNYILPTVETFVGKVTENRPGFMCMPATSDDDDQEAARQCDKLLEFIWERLGMQLKIHELAKWCALTPVAFLKCWWNPDGGELITGYEPVPGAEPDEMGQIAQKTVTKRTGFPHVDVLSCLEVSWDPGAKDMETCRWLTHINYAHIDDIRARYPKRGKYIDATNSLAVDEYSQLVVQQIRNGTNSDHTMVDRVPVVEYFEKPSPRYPRGLYAIVSNGIVLDKGELPGGEIPFVAVRHNTVPGRFAGEGLVKPIIPPQKELNKSVSQRIENKNLHAMPKYRAEKGSVEKGAITDEPGEIIFYNKSSTRPPEQLPPPPLSPEHRMIEQEQQMHIERISGVSDVTRGLAPSAISGRAIGLLADMDQTKMGPTVREFERAVENLSMMMLRMWRDNMSEGFTIQVSGDSRELEVFRFYSRNVKNTSVRVVANSMLPRHPSYRREQVLQMYQLGVLGDPNDPKTKMQARKMLEFGDMDKIYGDRDKDRNYAREENYVLANGEKPEPKAWEEHVTHIDTHLSFMKSVDYRLLSDEIKENFERHVAWHYWLESQAAQGVPWWQPNVMAGEQGWPPAGGPPQQQMPGQAPPAPMMDAFGPDPMAGEMAGEMGGEMPAIAPGMGGSPELNQAVGTRGPGVAEFENSFEM